MAGVPPDGPDDGLADKLREVSQDLGRALSSSGRIENKAESPVAAFQLVRELGPEVQLPLAVALTPDGRLLVLDRPGPERFRITSFAAGGEGTGPAAEFGKGSADEELLEPAGVAADRQGRMYVPDAGTGCVKQFSPDGRWLATFSSAGPDGSPFNGPRDVDVDGEGNLIVADTNNNRIVQLRSDGELGWVLDHFGPAGEAEDDEFYEPYSVCAGNGRLCVADTNQNRVLLFDARRRVVGSPAEAGRFVFPSGVRTAADGRTVYVADHGNLRVQRFDAAGARTGVLTIAQKLGDNVAVASGGQMAVNGEGQVVMVNPLRESVVVVAFVGS
jgi:DNA-binding beta-propeller fold protein YncE